jgi:O-antigen ligase
MNESSLRWAGFSLPVAAGLALALLLIGGTTTQVVAIALSVGLPLILYFLRLSFATVLKAIIFVVFFVPFQFFDFLNYQAIGNPFIFLGVVLFAKMLWDRVTGVRKDRISVPAVDALYLAFLLSAAVSTWGVISLLGALNWIVYSIVTGYLAYRAVLTLTPEETRSVLKFLVLSAAAEAAYGIVEFVHGTSFFLAPQMEQMAVPTGRLTSLLGHPLDNGLIFVSVIPFSLALFMETRQKRYLYALGVLLAGLILTLARGSWLALAIGVLAMLTLLALRGRMKSVLALTVAIGILAAVPGVSSVVAKRFDTSEEGRHSSWGARREAIPVALSIVHDYPLFGVGPFNEQYYRVAYTSDVRAEQWSFEDSYLALWVDFGYVGAGLLLLLGLTFMRIGLFSPWRQGPLEIYRVAAVTAFISLTVNMATFDFNDNRLFHFVIWFFAGMVVVWSKGVRLTQSLETSRE